MDKCWVFLTIVQLYFVPNVAKITDEEYALMPDLFQYENFGKCLFGSNKHSVYCTITLQVFPQDEGNVSKVWTTIKETINLSDSYYRHDLLRFGICASKICKTDNNNTIFKCFKEKYSKKYEHLGLRGEIVEMRCEKSQSEYTVRKSDKIFLLLLLSYIGFVICVTFHLQWTKPKVKTDEEVTSKASNFLSCFNVIANYYKLFDKIDAINRKKLGFIQGMRVIASIMVIAFHVGGANVATPVLNPSFVEENLQGPVGSIAPHGALAVQIFVVTSFYLLGQKFFSTLKETNNKKIPFRYVATKIIKRFVALSMLYAILLGFSTTWIVHLTRGPFSEPIIGAEYKMCHKVWWKGLLLVYNLFIDDGMCLGHSWYLSVDFHCAVIGLVVLWYSQNKPKLFFRLLLGLCSIQIVVSFFYFLWNDYKFIHTYEIEQFYNLNVFYSKEWQANWVTTFTSLSGVAVGLFFAFLFSNKIKIFPKNSFFLATLIISCFFGPILFANYYVTTSYFTSAKILTAAYGSVHKIIHTFGWGLVLYSLSEGFGAKWINILEWRPLQTLGQLSFGAFLVHYSLCLILAASRQTVPYVSFFSLGCDVVVIVTMSYLFSAIFTVIFIMPVLEVLKKY